MAASDRSIKRDISNQPVPQVYDQAADEFQYVLGTAGRQHVIIYTADGAPVDFTPRDLRGLIDDRPDAGTVAVGTSYWAADRIGLSDEYTVSDGSDWQAF